MARYDRRRALRTTPAINVTPLVDVLLILLVILMLAMPAYVKRLAVDLPVTSLSGAPVAASNLRLTLLANGSLQLDGAPIDRAIAVKKANGSSVELAVDKTVPYEQLAQLLAELQGNGSREVSLLTF